jgi:hypothetical protein
VKGIDPREASDIAIVFVANPNNVNNVHLWFTDGTTSSGWYASHVKMGEGLPIITLSTRRGAPERPDMIIDFSRVTYILIELGDGITIDAGIKPPA